MAVKPLEKELFQSIFESSVEGILVVDNSGFLLRVNPAAERMFGYEPGELVNVKLEMLVPKHFRKKHKELREKFNKNPISRPKGLDLGLFGLKKNGVKFPIDVSLSATTVNGKAITIAFVTDTTELQTIVQKLKAKEAKDRALLEAIPDMMIIQNYAGDIIDFYAPENTEVQVPIEQIIGNNIKEIVPPAMSKAILKAHNEAIRTNKIQIREYSLDMNNKKVDYEARTVKLNNHSLLTIVRDITEGKRIEKEFRDIEAKNRAILEALPDLIIVHDKKGNVLQLNTTTPSSLVAPIEDLVGKNVKEFLPPKASVLILKALTEVYRTKKMALEHVTFPVKGKKIDYETRFVPFGEHILTIARDITKEKNAQQELKASEAKNWAIINALPDTIIIHDKEGNFLDVIAAEPSALFPVDEVIGKNVKDIFPPEVSGKIINALKKAHETQSLKVLKSSVPGKNRLNFLEGRITPLEDDKLLVVVRDITESKALQDKLYVRNRALKAAGNGIIIADAQQLDNPIIYSNEAFTQITGYTRSEAHGRNCRFLQKDDRNQEELKSIRKAIKDGHACHEILRNYKKDGTLFYNELTITPVYDDDEVLTHFIGVQNDVTKQKKEELLKDQIRGILEKIAQHWPLDFIGDAIVETVEQQFGNCMVSISLLNREHGKLHHLSAPNLPKPLKKALDGLTVKPNLCPCCSAAHLKKEIIATDLSKYAYWKDLEALSLEKQIESCWSFPILSSGQEVLGVFTLYFGQSMKPGKFHREIIEDITFLSSVAIEQHNSRITLQENRKQLAAYSQELELQVEDRTTELSATVKKLVESNLSLEDQVKETKIAENKAKASQFLFATIAKNLPKGAIALVNSQYQLTYLEGGELSNFGIEGEQYQNIAIDDLDLLSKDEKSAVKESVRRTLKGEHLSFEIVFKENAYTVNTIPLGEEDGRQALFVYNNITMQKKVESEILRALHKEQELNELKSRFISMASHEFRTPLSAILSSAILIEKQNEPGKEAKREKYLDQIKTNVRNLVIILNDFLSLSKLEEGKVIVRKERFDLVQFSKILIEEIDSSKKIGQQLTLIPKKPSIIVSLDPKLTRHILINLLSNAIKYSDENKNIDVILKKKKASIVLKVIDQGIGIPTEEQSNLFQRFFRAENSTNIQGTGLGLHIVKQYTELMGGTVYFESVLNKGTTFTVELPTE